MRKLHMLMPAVALAVASLEASAQTFYEPFDYPAAATLDVPQVNPGHGTLWNKTGTGTANITVGGSSLPATGIPASIGGSALFPNTATGTGNVDRISFANVVQTNTTVYYSMLLTLTQLPTQTTGANAFIAGFNNYTNPSTTAASSLAARLVVEKSPTDPTKWVLGLGSAAGTSVRTFVDSDPAKRFNVGTTVLVVAALNVSTAGIADDTMSLWINPTGVGNAAADTPDINAIAAGTDLTDGLAANLPQIASFWLKSQTTANIGAPTVDEVRVDTSWAGVLPNGSLQRNWTAGAPGNWGDDLNWSGTNPNQLGGLAVFGPAISGGVVSIPAGGKTVESIRIDNANGLTFSGDPITISTNASAGQIVVLQGNHTISSALNLSSSLDVHTGAGATLFLTGAVTGTAKSIGKYGSGTLALGASNIIDDTTILNVRVGTLDMNGQSETVDSVRLGTASDNNSVSVGGGAFTAGNIIGAGTLTANTFVVANGTISANLAGGSLTKKNAVTVTLSGVNSYTGGTTVANGILQLTGNGSLGTGTVTNNATLQINSNATLPAIDGAGITKVGDGALASTPSVVRFRTPTVNILANSTAKILTASNPMTNAGTVASVSNVTTVTVAANARLNLNNARLITNDAQGTKTGVTYSGILGLVQTGRAGGAWNGPGIITDQADALLNKTSIGVATAAEAKSLSGVQTTLWSGQTIDANDTLVMYTYAGDANLDGAITADDYASIDLYFLAGGQGTWYRGDFNYDGDITADDYALIDSAFIANSTPFWVKDGPRGATAALSAVPEPASVSMLAVAAIGLTARRRRTR